jgi:hypothetical protein
MENKPREPMPPAKAFWNAFAETALPLLVASVCAIYFLKPKGSSMLEVIAKGSLQVLAKGNADALVVLGIFFWLPGALLCLINYRRYRNLSRPGSVKPRTLMALGITLLLSAAVIIVATLVPSANHKPVDQWDLWSSLGMAVFPVTMGLELLSRAGVFRRRSSQETLEEK